MASTLRGPVDFQIPASGRAWLTVGRVVSMSVPPTEPQIDTRPLRSRRDVRRLGIPRVLPQVEVQLQPAIKPGRVDAAKRYRLRFGSHRTYGMFDGYVLGMDLPKRSITMAITGPFSFTNFRRHPVKVG